MLAAVVGARRSLSPSRTSRQRTPSLKDHGYTELKKLGKGQFGYAILVRREESREHYVAKLMPYKQLNVEEKEFISREVRVMSHISNEGGHPYLVRFRQAFTTGGSGPHSGKLCIIMDHCDGGDLQHAIRAHAKKGERFTEAQVKLWLMQLLSAVDFLHCRKVLHRDIKPANIFMHSGVCKLGDLGLSKQVRMTATKKQAHTQCGSPLYLAPEVHMGQSYGKAVDIWSVGCTLFELMMLSHAFVGEDNGAILQNIVWARHAPINRHYSEGLQLILKWMLSLKPDDRPCATDVFKEPLFTEMLGAKALHPQALKHELGLVRKESPVGIDTDVLDGQMGALAVNNKPPNTIDLMQVPPHH